LLITGASRGIGLAIGIRAARDGANVAILAKTTAAHPQLPAPFIPLRKMSRMLVERPSLLFVISGLKTNLLRLSNRRLKSLEALISASIMPQPFG